ncbi:MAG: hypothetical protein KBT11_09240 [Treponema sp.]|nr:hypothetical protein [Candidatus Treponema equifaecale]
MAGHMTIFVKISEEGLNTKYKYSGAGCSGIFSIDKSGKCKILTSEGFNNRQSTLINVVAKILVKEKRPDRYVYTGSY